VAFVSKKRWDGVEDEDDLLGAPELVIEVLSRSDRAAKLQELAALCLSGGTQELWAIDPLGLFGGELAVSEIFA
jgi:Uma2 family endonuclease